MFVIVEVYMSDQLKKDECCARFDPAPWDGKTIEWKDKRFVKDSVFTLFYIPMNFGSVISRLIGKVVKSGSGMSDSVWLSDHTSKWNMDLYLAVDKEVPDATNTTMSGRFMFKVYEGDFKNTGKWCKEFEGDAKGKGITFSKLYTWYTTCPKCAKKYGKNYVVIVGKV